MEERAKQDRASQPTPKLGSRVLTPEQWRELADRLRFSERELEVVQGVFDDLKESAIAARLGISGHTVHTHLERLYRKLTVSGRCQMVVEVFAEHLRTLDGARSATTQ